MKNIQISTNGELLTTELAERLFKLGANDMRFSVDAIHKDTYERIRVGRHFDNVMSNIENAIQMRDENYHDIAFQIRLVEQKEIWARLKSLNITGEGG